jgi:hypothetical protein
MDKVTHKDHETDLHATATAADDDDNSFLHKTSKDTGAFAEAEKRKAEGGGIKGVY